MSTPAVDRPADQTTSRSGAAHPRHVAVVGGGITGLSAAWYLNQQAARQGVSLRVTVLEASHRWGGKVRTEHVETSPDRQPFIIEAGPDSFLTQKPWALQLARELGLDDRVLNTNDAQRKVYVLRDGRPVPLPDGVMMIVPTKIMPFVLTPLFSIWGKLRMGLDLIIPARRDGQDETLAEFITRRLGAEALDRLAEPLMSGIYNADADQQSLLATFPRFRALEEKYGSLIRGMLASRRARRSAPKSPSGKKKTAMFVSLKAGTHELIAELVAALDADLRLNTPVADIRHDGEGYTLTLPGAEELHADAVLLATPAYTSANLLAGLIPQDAVDHLNSIRYVSTGTLSIAFRSDEVDNPLDGFGLVIPNSENRPINAVTCTSIKFDHRAPGDHLLLRVFFGGSRSPYMMHKSDAELLAIVREQLADILGITANPVLHRIYRWFDSNPQYDVNHLQRVDAIEEALPPDLYVTGSAYRGIGMPDCVHQAGQTAEKIVTTLKEKTRV